MKLDRFTYDWWNDHPPKEDEGEDRHRDRQEAEEDFKQSQEPKENERDLENH